jgi:(S)-sulfolactate dehydrogenase
MAEVIVTEFMDPAALRHFSGRYDVLADETLVDDPQRLVESLNAARGLIVRNRTQVDERVLDAAPTLEVIGRLGVGLDNIDLTACEARNIRVCPATGANDLAVAEYVIAGTLLMLRGAYNASEQVLQGAWPRQALTGRETAQRVLGLVGFGGIARETAKRAKALGMQVLAHDPFVPADDPDWDQIASRVKTLRWLLENADVVSLHVPYNSETRHLIDAEAIAAMKPEAILINAARGGIVEESALASALTEQRLGGAMLDVFQQEPLPDNSVLVGAPNLVVTPHIAGVTVESNQRVSDLTARNVLTVLEENDRGH